MPFGSRRRGPSRAPFFRVGLFLQGLFLAETSAAALPQGAGAPRICEEGAVVAKALPAESVEVRWGPGFALAESVGTTAFCVPGRTGDEALVGFAKGVTAALGVDPHFVVVLADAWPGCDVVHYVPLSNDVPGIGYARTNADELFDDDPEAALLGVAFLNDIPYWRENPDEYRSTFVHELGHRWGARVHAFRDGVDYDLTGRQRSHWGYFVETFDSPLEGNRFRAVEGAWVVEATRHPLVFSPLDLYLMGIRSAAEVPPFRFFPEGTVDGVDCRGNRAGVASGPQWCEDKTVVGTPIELSAEDVRRAEGERPPEARGRAFDVLFVVATAGAGLGEAVCEFVEEAIPGHLADFERATEGGLGLLLAEGSDEARSCAELARTPEPGGCGLAGLRAPAPVGFLGGLFVAFGLHRRRGVFELLRRFRRGKLGR